jgi:thioredoxin-related protein
VWAVLLGMPCMLHGQNHGIKWAMGFDWKQVIGKAKAEKKYIFLDCYTTWCAPCKRMDNEVYKNDSVGDFMNSNFICVKVQMDRTINDEKYIKSWYNDAEIINKKYGVASYPTYLFFSSDGEIVHRAGSYISPADFIAMAKRSLNPKEQYYSLLAQYKAGCKDYLVMPYLIKMAKKLNEQTLLIQLQSDYLDYLSTLKTEELHSKERLEFISLVMKGTKSQFFKLFYPNGEKVNSIMGEAGFSRRTTDSVIAREFINHELKKLSINQDPNWSSWFSIIKKKFNQNYAIRNILWKKVRWFDEKKNPDSLLFYFKQLVEVNGLDTSRLNFGDGWLNNIAYIYVFGGTGFAKGTNDTTYINAAIKWMEGVIARSSKYSLQWQAMTIDTYAMLLYKATKKEQAIKWEEKAIEIAELLNSKNDLHDFERKIAKMKKNETIWQ